MLWGCVYDRGKKGRVQKIVQIVTRVDNTTVKRHGMWTLFRRIFIFFVLAVFTTSIFADAIIMTIMSSNMASSTLEHMDVDMNGDLDECDNCLSKSDHCGICDAGCTTALNALLDSNSLKFIIAVEHFLADSPQAYISNTGPPDPFPPRSPI